MLTNIFQSLNHLDDDTGRSRVGDSVRRLPPRAALDVDDALVVDGFGAGDLRRPVNALLRLIFFCFSGSLYGEETAASFSVLIIASGCTSSFTYPIQC